jgi:parallel beta-helix repeat protein
MITQMNNIAQVWWNWMWPMFWQVSVLVIFLGALDLILRKHVWPQVRYALWLLVLIKLILPPTFSLSTSIISQARIKAEWMATQLLVTNNRAEISSAGLSSNKNMYLTDTGTGPFVESEIIMPNVTSEPHVEINSSSITESEVNIKLHWHSFAMIVWLIVLVALSLWVVVRFRKLRKFNDGRFSSTDLPQWFVPLLTQTAEKLGLRKIPKIALSRNISSPAVFGVFRPVLVLPAQSVRSLSQKRTEHILLHELAHIKRGDLLVNTFYMLLQIVYWFNPLLWLIRRRLQHIRELCCDATVARILREKTVDYRETILEVTQRYLAGSVEPGLGLLGMTEDSSRILIRLKWLQRKTWRYRGIRIAMIFIVVALMLVCVLPMARAKNTGVLTVAADGSAKYSSIQEAIDAADTGTVIRIGPGIYEEHLKINKPVKLEGSGWDKTTIITKSAGADAVEEAMRMLNIRMQDAKTDEQRKEIEDNLEQEFKEKYGKPTLLVSDTEDVVIRDLKLTSPGRRLKGGTMSIPILGFSNAKASVSKCVVIGAPGDGIHIFNGSNVEIRDSLVAAVWSTGIVVGEKQGESSGLRLFDSELRNCHYAGIRIRGGNDSTRLERCRISGAAWHGIRYDDCSPAIIGNRIFANARCGIYASGQTVAIVKGNIFSANEMVGMSCWFQNRDTIEGNTFASNKRSGLEILGASKPIVKNNIFFSEPNGVQCANISSNSAFAVSDGIVTLEKNLFWNNKHNAVRRLAKSNTTEKISLEKQAGNVEIDPGFVNSASNDFSLMADSPARRLGMGVTEPIGFESPWPLQPEEAAIIPDGQTRDYRQWKTPAKTASFTTNPTVLGKSETVPFNPSDIALLYHRDRDVRSKSVRILAASNNPTIIDDLIRAHSVENYTPIHNEYDQALQSLTGTRNIRGKTAWKAWLATEVKAGRLKIDYLPVEPAVNVQSEMLPFALTGPDDFNEMASALTKATYDRGKCRDALRYMVFNDNLAQVQEFLSGDWLVHLFTHQKININDIGYFLNGLANPGPVRRRINTHVRDCFDSENPTVVANTLNLIAGVEGYSTRFVVPGVEDKVKELTSSSVPEIAFQAQRALEKIRPGYTGAVSTQAMSRESLPDVKDIPGELIFHGRYKHPSPRRDNESELWLKRSQAGAITAIAQLPSMASTIIASGDRHNRFTHYKDISSPTGRSGYSIDLELLDGKVLLTRRGIRQDCDNKELKVPEGALFSPNTRPDSYCAANILLRGFGLEEGQSKEFRVYDWDNSGEAMADYTIRVEHTGTETVDVPAGTFKADHIVLTQATSADTWFKKRAGHVTDFWVLDNGVIVRVLRHREPYEIQLLDYDTPAELPGKLEVSEQVKAAPVVKSGLQRMIDSMPAGQTVTILKGVYSEPVTVSKPLTLKGESRNECIFEVTSNQPAISIDSKGKGKVLIEGVTVKWQLATSDKTEQPFAVAVKDTVVEVKNCCFQPLGNFKRSPVAIYSRGFSELNVDTCRFEGFEYTVCFGEGTKGTIRNSLVMDSGHQGIILYAGATVEITGNVVTGSRFHAVRSTGGTLNMTNNLIINNANRGVYLGNKSASGKISNNVIIGNGTGVGGFARSNVRVENNVIVYSSYAGIGMRDSCRLSIHDNIFRGNERGLILFQQNGGNGNNVLKNTFWQNKVDTENMNKPADSIVADPGFVDAENGDFSLKPGPAMQQKQGLTKPEIFKKLWKIWMNRRDKNMPFTEN